MHFAAALERPCVVVAGGREQWWWESYVPGLGHFGTDLVEDVRVPHSYLHTLGLLDCCKHSGCWKNNVTGEASTCRRPVQMPEQTLPECMDMVGVDHVVDSVMAYYERGLLPPIGRPRKIEFVDGRPILCSAEQDFEQPSALGNALAGLI